MGSEEGREAWVSMVSTARYLPGVLTLFDSLRRTGTSRPFCCMITEGIDGRIDPILRKLAVHPVRVPAIDNPACDDPANRHRHTYSKLHVFGLSDFSRVVYLDADMVVCHDIDDLFDHPHLSSTNAGGLVHPSWRELNSGLMVVEPDRRLFEDMMSSIGRLTVEGLGDQEFLHAFYPDWPDRTELHLSHVYNVFHDHLDQYCGELGFMMPGSTGGGSADDERSIRIIHYIGTSKPWMEMERIARSRRRDRRTLGEKLWVEAFDAMMAEVPWTDEERALIESEASAGAVGARAVGRHGVLGRTVEWLRSRRHRR